MVLLVTPSKWKSFFADRGSSLFASPTEHRLRIDARLTRDAVRPARNDPVLPVGDHQPAYVCDLRAR